MRCRMGKYKRSATVLIYPYWNVNTKEAIAQARARYVLIYPYWNVNGSAKSDIDKNTTF